MSSKIDLDKYYTNNSLAERCINMTKETLKDCRITEILEPSAGNGAFSSKIENCVAYDIEPEAQGIIRQDFLTLTSDYKKGRLIIGNPPFGNRMNLARKFYKKSITMGDYIAFILPISQLNNNRSMYEFDLIRSEDLGKEIYSDRMLHCCFNIYVRPQGGSLNTKPTSKLQDVTIVRYDSVAFQKMEDYDIRMCYWGNGSAGKILSEGENYSAEYKLKVNNESIRDEVMFVLHDVNWRNRLNKVAMLSISQFHIIDLLKETIPNIK